MESVDPYGTIYVESTWGSGGGSYVTNGNNGGRGGGFAHLYVRDTVTVSGTILANGQNSAVSSFTISTLIAGSHFTGGLIWKVQHNSRIKSCLGCT